MGRFERNLASIPDGSAFPPARHASQFPEVGDIVRWTREKVGFLRRTRTKRPRHNHSHLADMALATAKRLRGECLTSVPCPVKAAMIADVRYFYLWSKGL